MEMRSEALQNNLEREILMRSAAIVFMITLQCPAISTAQTASESTLTSLTLDMAVRQALENHPALGVARARVVIASARLLGSKSSYYPQIDANGIAKVGLSGASNGLGLKGLPASPFYRNLADSLNVYQNLHDFGRTARSMEEKKALLRSAEEELLATSAGIIANVYRAYFGLLQKQNVLEIARKSQNDRELTLRQAGAFFRAGLKSRLDLDLAQLNLDRARLRVLEGENDVARSQSELRAALGIVSPVEFAPVDDRQVGPPPAQLEELVARSLVERPELKAAAARSAAAEAVLELARSEARPRLAAVFSGGYAAFFLSVFLFLGVPRQFPAAHDMGQRLVRPFLGFIRGMRPPRLSGGVRPIDPANEPRLCRQWFGERMNEMGVFDTGTASPTAPRRSCRARTSVKRYAIVGLERTMKLSLNRAHFMTLMSGI
jgi:outer membrane protein TolC